MAPLVNRTALATTTKAQALTGLRPQVYEHSLDKKALDTLEGTPGLETLVRKCNEWGLERILRVQHTGSHLLVGADSFPTLFDLVSFACDTLDLPKRPEVYVGGLDGLNAFTAGIERPLVVLSSGLVDAMSTDELLFVVAHELGHIKSGHVLYHQIAEFLPSIGSMVGAATMGIGSLLGAGLEIALLTWKRASEFTADRAGLLGGQNPDAALSALMKIAGLPQKHYANINTADFIEQARTFETLDQDRLSWVIKGLSIMGTTHPWTVMRARELLTWIDSGDYERALTVEGPRFCTHCGLPVKAAAVFCSECGKRMPPLPEKVPKI